MSAENLSLNELKKISFWLGNKPTEKLLVCFLVGGQGFYSKPESKRGNDASFNLILSIHYY